MSLLSRLTQKNLKLNKKRSIVTMIGIMLATALLVAVATMAASFRLSMIDLSRNQDGNYHYRFAQVTEEQETRITNNRDVEQYYEMAGLGYSKLEESANEDKPYLYVIGVDKKAMEQSSLRLTQGRFPENDTELLISSHIQTNGGVTYHVGDKLELQLGKRTSKGKILTQDDSYDPEETWEPGEKKTYTIVGICERPSTEEEYSWAPGYSVFTYCDTSKMASTYAGKDVYARFSKQALRDRKTIEKTYKDMDVFSNATLLQYETLDLRDSSLSVLYGMSGIVFAIIVLTSVFCISNSFQISISEKTKQYGMLASIGATPRQIKQNVYYEGYLLGAIATPLGVGCGLLASCILVKIVNVLLKESLQFELHFRPSLVGILLAVLLTAVTIFFAAGKPSRKASKISPIVAIHGNEEIKLRAKEVKTPGYIKKLFGIGGVLAYKNKKRNRKKYRVATISIAISVTTFVALYGFMSLMFRGAQYYLGENGYTLSVSMGSYQQSMDEAEKVVQNLESQFEIKDYTLVKYSIFGIQSPKYSDAMKKWMKELSIEDVGSPSVVVMSPKSYENYVISLGLNPKETKEGAILVNERMSTVGDDDRKVSYSVYDYQKGDTLSGHFEVDRETKKAEMPITAITDKKPVGFLQTFSDAGMIIVENNWMEKASAPTMSAMTLYLDSDDADQIQASMIQAGPYKTEDFYNALEEKRSQDAIYLVIEIFMYGFIVVISLIGITNIFNTITTSMELRCKEFAMLRSIGMTKAEFNRMVGLESLFYGGKALVIGLIVGSALSYVFHRQLAKELELAFQLPYMAILIAVCVVFLLLLWIMKYSIRQIQKQNIIETIRNENI